MRSPVISINAEANIKGAIELINEKKIGSLLVKEGKNYAGIITKTDLIQKVILRKLNYKKTKIHTIMTDVILTIDHETPIDEAVGMMNKNQVRHLAVTENGGIVGIISIKNITDYFSDEYIKIFY